MSRKLDELQALAALVRDRELERLRELAAARARLEDKAAALRDRPAAVDGLSPAARAGAEARWRDWRAARLTALSHEIARAAAEAEQQRYRAQRAFGRAEVLSRLREGKKR